MPLSFLRPAAHLSFAEVEQRYQAAATPRHQRYWNLIRLMLHPKEPLSVTAAAHASGFSQRWARQLVHRYNQKGPESFYDQRRHNPGQRPLLTTAQKNRLREAISSGLAPDGGLWTSVKVADWIEQETGYRPSGVTGWHYLLDLGFTLQIPRPRNVKAASPEEVAAFKKN